jgi:hypothetical protein
MPSIGGSLWGVKVVGSDGASLIATTSGGTLSGVTLASDLDVSSGSVTIRSGLTLDGAKVRIGDRSAFSSGTVSFEGGTQAIDGTGDFVLGASYANRLGAIGSGAADEALTIGSGITIRGNAGTSSTGFEAQPAAAKAKTKKARITNWLRRSPVDACAWVRVA